MKFVPKLYKCANTSNNRKIQWLHSTFLTVTDSTTLTPYGQIKISVFFKVKIF